MATKKAPAKPAANGKAKGGKPLLESQQPKKAAAKKPAAKKAPARKADPGA